MKFIIGLGNPGKDYEYTRHNLGKILVKELARNNKLQFRKNWRLRSSIAFGKIGTQEVKLIFPHTFMNVVGGAVARLVKANNIELDDLLVICDDINLELGKMRIRASGSDGGHKGLRSIIEVLGTQRIPRLRIGIGSPTHKEELSDFVLSDFTGKEEKELAHAIDRAQQCCKVWLRGGIALAMSKFN